MARRLAERPAAPPLPPELVPVEVDEVRVLVPVDSRLLMEDALEEITLEALERSEETDDAARSELRHTKPGDMTYSSRKEIAE